MRKIGRILLCWSPRRTRYWKVETFNEEGNLKPLDIRDEQGLEKALALVRGRYRAMTA